MLACWVTSSLLSIARRCSLLAVRQLSCFGLHRYRLLLPAGGHIHSAPAAVMKIRTPTTHTWINQGSHSPSLKQRSSRRACEYLAEKERSSWCGSRAAAAALQWQAVDEAFLLPPLCAHTSAAFSTAATVTGSLGRNHSGLSAGGAGMQRGCPRQQPQQLSSSIQRHSSVRANGRRRRRTHNGRASPTEHFNARYK